MQPHLAGSQTLGKPVCEHRVGKRVSVPLRDPKSTGRRQREHSTEAGIQKDVT